MGNLKERSGILQCPGCHSELGQYNWDGISCACGGRSKPSFALYVTHVE